MDVHAINNMEIVKCLGRVRGFSMLPGIKFLRAHEDFGYSHLYSLPYGMRFKKGLMTKEFVITKNPVHYDYGIEMLAIPYSRSEQVRWMLKYYRDRFKDVPLEFCHEPKYIEKLDRTYMGACVTPSSKEPGRLQISFFDEDGFSGDTTRDTELESICECLDRGYRIPCPGLMKEIGSTQRFWAGVENLQKAHKKWYGKAAA